MNRSKNNIAATGTASALALFALVGTACAQEAPDDTYDAQTQDAREMDSGMDERSDMNEPATTDTYGTTDNYGTANNQGTMDAKRQDEAHQMATMLGVSELNDIEDWKITHSGQEIGEIDRLGMDASTGELLAVVGLDGVLGLNMKEVGIPLKKLQKSGDETLSTELTKEELQQQRDIDPWDGTYSQTLNEGVSQ